MRDENLEIIERHMFFPEEQQTALTEKQRDMLEQVTDCYHLQLQKPMLSRAALRAYLVKRYKCSSVRAYRIIQYTANILGNVQPSHKNWIRQRIEFLSEQAYIAVEAKDYKRAEALTKIATTLSKAFQTNLDEGEIINAQKYLEIDTVNLLIDPSVLGIKISEPTQKEINFMLKKYQIEDVEAEVIEEDEP